MGIYGIQNTIKGWVGQSNLVDPPALKDLNQVLSIYPILEKF